MPMAVDVAPERRDAVDVATAFGVDQRRPLGALDDDRLLVDPALLLRERGPDVAGVVGGEGHAAEATARASRKPAARPRHRRALPGSSRAGREPGSPEI